MACFCIGPQNGDPVCPCRMRADEERRKWFRKLWRDLQQKKPRVRVKAGRRFVYTFTGHCYVKTGDGYERIPQPFSSIYEPRPTPKYEDM